jgi:NlpC/P60 family
MKKLLIGVPIAILLLMGLLTAGLATHVIGGSQPSAQAQRDIPPQYLALYMAAADTCPNLPWSVLAAIGKVESDHGRSTAPGVTTGMNFAGAAGPMQFGIGGKAGNTWASYGVDADQDGVISVYEPADAIFAAAKYLCANGAHDGRLSDAIFAYNHASWYVQQVLVKASEYAATTVALPAGPAAQAAVDFAYAQLGRPYSWGATGQEGFYDCSGLMLAAYRSAGIELPRTSREQWFAGARILDTADLQPGDLVFYATNLSDPSTIHHVGIYVGAGNMIDAPHRNAFVRVEPFVRGDYIGAVRPTLPPA